MTSENRGRIAELFTAAIIALVVATGFLGTHAYNKYKAECHGQCGANRPGHRECEDLCLTRDNCPHWRDK